MEHKGIDSGHTPCLLRGTGAMTCSPGSHTTIIHFTKGACRHTGSLGDCGDSLHTGILGVEPTRIGRGAALGSLVGLEGLVGFWILPGHLLTPGDLAMTLSFAPCGEPAIVFRGPQHCIICVKNQTWEILELPISVRT